MKIWLDAQLSPAIAIWLEARFAVTATELRELGLRDSTDRDVFLAARREGATIMTKDEDFVYLPRRWDPLHRSSGSRAATPPMPSSNAY